MVELSASRLAPLLTTARKVRYISRANNSLGCDRKLPGTLWWHGACNVWAVLVRKCVAILHTRR